MKNSRASRRYAVALMGVAEEQKSLDSVAKDLEVVASTLAGSRELRVLAQSPIVSASRKLAAFRALFASRVGPIILKFIELLVSKRREEVLQDVSVQFRALLDEQLGISNVDVVSAVKLDAAQEKALVVRLEKTTGRKIRLHASVDPRIKGGLMIRMGDTVHDASIRRQLQILRSRFSHETAVPS